MPEPIIEYFADAGSLEVNVNGTVAILHLLTDDRKRIQVRMVRTTLLRLCSDAEKYLKRAPRRVVPRSKK